MEPAAETKKVQKLPQINLVAAGDRLALQKYHTNRLLNSRKILSFLTIIMKGPGIRKGSCGFDYKRKCKPMSEADACLENRGADMPR